MLSRVADIQASLFAPLPRASVDALRAATASRYEEAADADDAPAPVAPPVAPPAEAEEAHRVPLIDFDVALDELGAALHAVNGGREERRPLPALSDLLREFDERSAALRECGARLLPAAQRCGERGEYASTVAGLLRAFAARCNDCAEAAERGRTAFFAAARGTEQHMREEATAARERSARRRAQLEARLREDGEEVRRRATHRWAESVRTRLFDRYSLPTEPASVAPLAAAVRGEVYRVLRNCLNMCVSLRVPASSLVALRALLGEETGDDVAAVLSLLGSARRCVFDAAALLDGAVYSALRDGRGRDGAAAAHRAVQQGETILQLLEEAVRPIADETHLLRNTLLAAEEEAGRRLAVARGTEEEEARAARSALLGGAAAAATAALRAAREEVEGGRARLAFRVPYAALAGLEAEGGGGEECGAALVALRTEMKGAERSAARLASVVATSAVAFAAESCAGVA